MRHRCPGALRMIIVSTMFVGAGGCLVDFPSVRSTGEVIGGDRKLNSLLAMIASMRGEAARRDLGVAGVFYSCSLNPTWQSVAYSGAFAGTDQLAASEYTVVCAGETVGSARAAVVHEVVFYQDATCPPKDRTVLLFLEDNRWIVHNPHLLRERHLDGAQSPLGTTPAPATQKFIWNAGRWSEQDISRANGKGRATTTKQKGQAAPR